MKKTLIALLLLTGFQAAFADTQSGNDRPRGFLFYDDKQLPTIKVTPKKKPSEEIKPKVSGSPIVVQPQNNASVATVNQPEPFSVEWLRQSMPILLDNAMNNPTEENVRAYKYAERVMMDMASNFADQSMKVVRNDPMLDESVRMPISSMARSAALYEIAHAREAIIRDLQNKGGLWFFFDSKCHFCDSQYQVLQLMEEKYGIHTKYISTDGGVLQGMPRNKVAFDRQNIAKELGVKVLPAIVLAVPPDKTAIISHGASALSDLEEKTVLAAIDMNLASPELTNTAELRKRGILRPEDMQQARQQMQNPKDPNELVRIINQAIQKRM